MTIMAPSEETQERRIRREEYIQEISEAASDLLKEFEALIVKISKGGKLLYGDARFSLESLMELTSACIESYVGNNTAYVFVVYKLGDSKVNVDEFTGKDLCFKA